MGMGNVVSNIVVTMNGTRQGLDLWQEGGSLYTLYKCLTAILYTWDSSNIECPLQLTQKRAACWTASAFWWNCYMCQDSIIPGPWQSIVFGPLFHPRPLHCCEMHQSPSRCHPLGRPHRFCHNHFPHPGLPQWLPGLQHQCLCKGGHVQRSHG